MIYTDKAYEYAKAQGWTSEDVRLKSYKEIAAACGVKIEANGNSPKDFFYVNIRRNVMNRLGREERVIRLEVQRVLLSAKIKTVSSFEDSSIEYDDSLKAWVIHAEDN